MKQRVCIYYYTQMLNKCLTLSITKKTASFLLPLVFIWLLILLTNPSIIYGLTIPFGPNFSVPDLTTETAHQPSRVETTIFQPSYMLSLTGWPILLPPPPSSFIIPAGVASHWFPSSIFLFQNSNQQQYNFERGQQLLQPIQNRIEEQQMLQQQQLLGNSEPQQIQRSPYLLPSLVNSNEPQKQTINDQNRQCINNICTIQSTQCTNGVCTTTTTNDNGNTVVNTQVCSSGSNNASSPCLVRQTQITQCTGDGACTITQTECINEICSTNIARTF
jgi:hypothetical protein